MRINNSNCVKKKEKGNSKRNKSRRHRSASICNSAVGFGNRTVWRPAGCRNRLQSNLEFESRKTDSCASLTDVTVNVIIDRIRNAFNRKTSGCNESLTLMDQPRYCSFDSSLFIHIFAIIISTEGTGWDCIWWGRRGGIWLSFDFGLNFLFVVVVVVVSSSPSVFCGWLVMRALSAAAAFSARLNRPGNAGQMFHWIWSSVWVHFPGNFFYPFNSPSDYTLRIGF